MEKEISISKILLIEKLTNIADSIKRKYGVSVWFVDIFGRRWSYLVGRRGEGISFLPPERIKINNHFGVVSNDWKDIPVDERKKLILSIRKIVRSVYG